MNYNYGNQFQPQYYNPYQARIDAISAQMPSQTMSAPRYEIIHVNGKNGADALQMAPNSNIIVMDDTAPMVWMIVADGAGYKTATPFDITPHQSAPTVDVGGLESRVKRLEDIFNGYQSNGGASKRSESDAANEQK
jgi:hypothetical protein